MNPVLHERITVLFGEGHGLPVYFYLLIVLAPVEFLALVTPLIGAREWSGAGSLFKVTAAVAIVLVGYFALRIANQEYAASRFRALRRWTRDDGQTAGAVAWGQVSFLVLEIACLLAVAAPLLVWAAAIARTPAAGLAATLALIPFYAFCYGVWGLVGLVKWEGEPDTRETAVRCFVTVVLVLAMAIYMPLNPVAYVLAILGGQEPEPLRIAALELSADAAHFGFHLALGGAGLAAYLRGLRRIL